MTILMQDWITVRRSEPEHHRKSSALSMRRITGDDLPMSMAFWTRCLVFLNGVGIWSLICLGKVADPDRTHCSVCPCRGPAARLSNSIKVPLIRWHQSLARADVSDPWAPYRRCDLTFLSLPLRNPILILDMLCDLSNHRRSSSSIVSNISPLVSLSFSCTSSHSVMNRSALLLTH